MEQIRLSYGHASLTTTERYWGIEQDLEDAPCDTTAMAASSAPLSDPTIIVHFDIGALQQPENITLEPDGSAVVAARLPDI
jgi:hypothetical protein